ncbi:LacI family DNA-binding transcriptional regulator [Pararhodobacter sp.]|uniref:LacI family DNA-binding transcriptional regulator n=1 Tax=Pararhodobacter sp. TaxID=2127056 RepID=UPI002AFED365|nr:LacI family DNA-binding transcriptional regulator [Pararhodobacter sp.]
MTQRRSVTSYDVAQAANVSQSAVSRAFSANASISENTRKRVLDAARQLGYTPNAIARSMSTARKELPQKSGMVGVIVTRLEDPFFAHTIAHFSRDLQARGWHMLLFTVDSQAEVDDALSGLLQYQIDGVIILSAILSDHMANVCHAQGTPVLLYNRNAKTPALSSIGIENYAGGRLAADILREAGHDRIAFVGSDGNDDTSREREAGFVARLAEDGLSLFQRESGDYTFVSGREAGLRLFARAERPDAVFCASDVMALGVLHAAKFELGLRVAQDFSLVGFDDIPAASWPGHRLTTIRQPIQAMIRQAVEILAARMENSDLAPQTTRVPGTLILRETVRGIGPSTSATFS